MPEYTINYENDFPFILYASTEVATNARTPVITRSSYQFCTVEFIRDGAGFLEIDGKSFHIRQNGLYFLTPGSTKDDDDVYDLGSARCRILLDKCRQLVSDENRKINVLAVAEGFRSAELPILVADCDKVTILFSGRDRNEETAASGLISSISKALTHGEIVLDYADAGSFEGRIKPMLPDGSRETDGAAV